LRDRAAIWTPAGAEDRDDGAATRRVRQDELAAAFAGGWNIIGIAVDAFAINPGSGTAEAGAWLATTRRL